MVSNELLFYIHLRLNKMFGSVNKESFAGVTAIVVGNLLQLTSAGERLVCANYKNNWENIDL